MAGGTYALIVAAGRGERLGGATPKQYLPLGGRPLLTWSLEVFSRHPEVEGLLCVIAPDAEALYREATAGLQMPAPVTGGASRQASVRKGLEALADLAPPERVLIHDAARPFPSSSLISRVLAGLAEADGALPALPVVDSLRRDAEGCCGEAVDREGLVRAQTPQGFRFAPILKAHQALEAESFTDDAALARAAGLTVRLVEGEEDAFKVTTETDMRRAERMAGERRETRIGQGYDVHRLIAGDAITLCGVTIPHDRTLEGHSDADVGLHALVDAILGALSKGDIGLHFPPSDPQWKGADSARFVEAARREMDQAGARVQNLDLTLICERPKIGPHREAMRARIAELLGLEPARINIKATTTERLGFTGREEGIAAQASVCLSLPSPGGES